jgi:hypothetical protein
MGMESFLGKIKAGAKDALHGVEKHGKQLMTLAMLALLLGVSEDALAQNNISVDQVKSFDAIRSQKNVQDIYKQMKDKNIRSGSFTVAPGDTLLFEIRTDGGKERWSVEEKVGDTLMLFHNHDIAVGQIPKGAPDEFAVKFQKTGVVTHIKGDKQLGETTNVGGLEVSNRKAIQIRYEKALKKYWEAQNNPNSKTLPDAGPLIAQTPAQPAPQPSSSESSNN